MAYQSNIPQATDRINDSQAQLLENFTQIKALIDVNHVTFGASGEGKHALVTFPNLAAPGAPAGADINIFNSTVLGGPELSIRKTGGAAIPFTRAYANGTKGWMYLPNGLLMAWGQGTTLSGSPAGDVTNVLFSTAGGAGDDAFPGFTTTHINVVLVRAHNATGTNFVAIQEGAPAMNQFTVYRSGGASAIKFNWQAIGR